MNVLILSQWYPPEPVELLEELGQALQASGHEVTVLTGLPNYPSGTLYPGYRFRLRQRETISGLPVVRVPLYPYHGPFPVGRALNYASFALSATLLSPLRLIRPDVALVYYPPPTIGLPAWSFRRLWDVPLVYQIQDMWPEALAATRMLNRPWCLGLVGSLATWVYAHADALCVTSPGFRENLVTKGVSPGKIHTIPNWVDTATYHPQPADTRLAERLGMAGRFNVMYAGNVGEAQGLHTVLEAARALRDLPRGQFVIVGDGVALPRLRRRAERQGLGNVRFLGRYPTHSMPALYALADVLLVHLVDAPSFRITIPHKIFAYMASGKPILAAVTGDAADLIRGAGAGIACPPGDAQALASAVRQFARMPAGRRGRMAQAGLRAVHRHYRREIVVARLESLLRSVVDSHRSVRG